jgi:hypothetical protein
MRIADHLAQTDGINPLYDFLRGQSFLSRVQTEFTVARWSIRPTELKG